jgi:hypothetical protein
VSEIIALVRLSLSLSKKALTIGLVYLLLIHLIPPLYGMVGAEQNEVYQQVASQFALLLSLPLLGVTFGLFDFSDRGDISSNATGYQPWLLRTPIKSWKLAAVPIVLKTLWTLIVCGAAALTCRFFGTPLERWFIPSIGIASVFVLACLITWHPFRWTYTRLALIGILFVPVYAWLIASVSFAFIGEHSRTPMDGITITAAGVTGLSTYAFLTLLALRAIRLARFNVCGQISESSGWASSMRIGSTASDAGRVLDRPTQPPATVSPVAALLNYERAKLAGVGAKATFVGWLLILLLASQADRVGTDSVVFLTVLFTFPAIFLNEWMSSSLDHKFLPNLLAVAPIPTTTLVWTRQIITTAIWFASLLGIPILFLIWTLKGANTAMNLAWQRIVASQFDAPDAAGRLGIVLVIVCALLVIRQTTWSVAMSAIDQKRFPYWMIAAKFAIGSAAFGWFLFHFLGFPDWEAWTQWAWQCIAQLPRVLPWLALVKLVILGAATTILYRSGLAKRVTIAALVVGFFTCTLLVAFAAWKLIPSDRVALWHCLAATAVLMPFSRIALAPICLARNRHR